MLEPIKPPPTPIAGEFPIGQEQLASISREHDTAALQQYGGVCLPRIFFSPLGSIFQCHKFSSVAFGSLSGCRTINFVENQFREGNSW